MADLTINSLNEANAGFTYESAAAGGDTVANDGRIIVLVKNGSGSSKTVTVAKQVTNVDDPQFGDLTKQDFTVSVPAGEERVIPPLSPQAYNDSNGDINISYSDNTSVEVAAFKLSDLKR